jgi:hypothetical protein
VQKKENGRISCDSGPKERLSFVPSFSAFRRENGKMIKQFASILVKAGKVSNKKNIFCVVTITATYKAEVCLINSYT